MKFTAAAFLLLSAFAAAEEAEKKEPAARMHVKIYEGPKECADEEKVVRGKHLIMHYTGYIDDNSETGEKGKKFDSSHDRNQTFTFQIGVGQVIPGWDKGLLNLCKGAKAILTIPPEMAYGEHGAGQDIPGGATLKFDVEVVDILDKAPEPPNVFKEIDSDEDKKLSKDEVEAWFQAKQGIGIPDGLWESEDKDGDGFITWDEFGGYKGDEL